MHFKFQGALPTLDELGVLKAPNASGRRWVRGGNIVTSHPGVTRNCRRPLFSCKVKGGNSSEQIFAELKALADQKKRDKVKKANTPVEQVENIIREPLHHGKSDRGSGNMIVPE